jgi:GTP-binding protein HflX
LLVHVVDASNPEHGLQIRQVQQVLKEIGAHDIPQLLVFNKVDAMDTAQLPIQEQDFFEIDGVQTPRLFVSARAGTGIASLRAELASIVARDAAAGAADHPALPEAES